MANEENNPEASPDFTSPSHEAAAYLSPESVSEPAFPPIEPVSVTPASLPEVPQLSVEPASITVPDFPGVIVASASAGSSITANPSSASDPFDIAAIEAEHAQWLSSEGKGGKRANFRGIDLTGVDLSGRHLMEASFRGAILRDANLSGADLRAANLSEAILDNANLNGALLYGASLARAQMHHAQANGADLTTADVSSAIAESIHLSDAKLTGAILRNANFRQADFTHAVLRDANMRGATLVEANLSAADLSAADCRDVNFDRSIFTQAILDKTNFRGAKLGGVDVHAPNFLNALDVAAEFQSQSLQSERAKIEEEQAQLANRERMLIQEKERINKQLANMVATMESNHAALAAKLRKLSLGFTIRFVLWLLIALAIVAMVLNRLDEIDFTNPAMMVILGGIVIVFLLAIMSMLRSIQIARLVKNFVAEKPEGIDTLEEATPAIPASPPSEPSLSTSQMPSVAPKKSGFGFGKKNK